MPIPSAPASPPDTFLEQYKTYVGDLSSVGSRHSDASKFYVSLLSALTVVQGVAGSVSALQSKLLTFGISVAGILICVLWRFTADSYSKLYRAKLNVIRELEIHLSHPCYKNEWDELQRLRFKPISNFEKWIAILMALLFAVLFAVPFVQSR
ncbi:MAG TPA: hypothetical protein VKS01_04600 [Bryobacteraceae bacterium]|nr:hypothetical protein [Bryobacteraceae bacterium]